jgi:hypothetical protein
MTFRAIVVALLIAATPAFANCAEPRDVERIRKVALDYIEGWYTRDPTRVERALHPQMIKRMVHADAAGQSVLDEGSGLRLVQGARAVPGKSPPPLETQRRDVQVLDVFGNAAIVKIDATEWVDYLQLVEWNGEWKILNVLWELRPSAQ